MAQKRMTKARYLKRMKQHEETFDRLWQKITFDTADFIRDNPEISMYSMSKLEKFIDNLCLSGAWVHDRINGYIGIYSHDTYRKSLTKKIRKALGYTL